MQIYLSPVENDKEKIDYQFFGEKIRATIGNQFDIFDFSKFKDGHASNIETILPYNVIHRAERINGELFVTLLNFIKENATNDEKFPSWKVV